MDNDLPRAASIHVDIDSPEKLLIFYGLNHSRFSIRMLEDFYVTAIDRALELFDKCNVKATFFCVGEDLTRSATIQSKIRDVFSAGHEIANHTQTHRYGITRSSRPEIIQEIQGCSDIIETITGFRPGGFRSPGYDLNNDLMVILEELGFSYDSSGFWSIITPLAKAYHKLISHQKEIDSGYGESSSRLPDNPYFPSCDDWQKKADFRKIIEIPLPKSRYLKLPVYSNFHLLTPEFYRSLSIKTLQLDYFVYLTHLIEYVDLTDGIPLELSIHPNIKRAASEKIRFLKKTIFEMEQHASIVRTDTYVDRLRTQEMVNMVSKDRSIKTGNFDL